MFARCNAHFEALAQRLLAAPGSMLMHVPQIVRICGEASVPSPRYRPRCVSSRVLNVCHVAAALFEEAGAVTAVDPISVFTAG